MNYRAGNRRLGGVRKYGNQEITRKHGEDPDRPSHRGKRIMVDAAGHRQ
ncbi:hypothetical protein SDC9_175913 [bioreactor metagenome]|uniref:Uncharacterized protein n=1 Tax=bioreactor metagenome TaxID=1076179 RepID=A0A645GNG5_9ZZZZ